jgi:uncharacterized protein YlxP (DUF503 family)
VFVLALEVDIHVGESQSLKDKRQVVKHLVETARSRYGVAAAEVDGQDTWQRATLGFATVSSSAAQAERVIDEVDRFVWSHPELQVLNTERRWLD